MSFSKPPSNFNEINKYVQNLLSETAGVLKGVPKVASGEQINDLVAHFPPRFVVGDKTYIKAGDPDHADYASKAAFHPNTDDAAKKVLHTYWMGDVICGTAIKKAWKGTDCEFITKMYPDDFRGRMSAYIYALKLECPADPQALKSSLLEFLVPVDPASPLLIRLDTTLPQHQQWPDWRNRIVVQRERLRMEDKKTHDAKVKDSDLIERVLTIAEALPRLRGKQVEVINKIKAETDFMACVKILISFDLDPLNKELANPNSNAAFTVTETKSGRHKPGGGPTGGGGKAAGKATGAYGHYSIAYAMQQEYKINGNDIVLCNGKEGRYPDGKSYVCIRCLASNHNIQACKKPQGPHEYRNDGKTLKIQRVCFQYQDGNCEHADCQFLHVPKPRALSTSSRKPDFSSFKKGKDYTVQRTKRGFRACLAETGPDSESDSDDEEKQPRKSAKSRLGGGKASKKMAWFNLNVGMPVIACLAMSMLQVDAYSPRSPEFEPEDQLFGNNSDTCFATTWSFEDAEEQADTETDSVIDTFRSYTVTKDDHRLPQSLRASNNFTAISDEGANLKCGSTYDKRNFASYTPCKWNEFVTGAGGEQHRIHGYGTIQLQVQTTTGKHVIHFRNMAYVPSFKQNLVGHRQLNAEGAFFGDSQDEHYAQLGSGLHYDFVRKQGLNWWVGKIVKQPYTEDHGSIHSEAWRSYVAINATPKQLLDELQRPGIKGVYQKETIIRTQLAKLGVYSTSCPDRDAFLHLHAHLGHPSHAVVVKWLYDNMTAAEIKSKYGAIAHTFCEVCAVAKVKAAPTSKLPVEKATYFGERIHMDVAGKFAVSARGTSYNYELGFIDSATGYIRLYPMTSCSEVSVIVSKHLQWVANRRKTMQAKSKATPIPTFQPELLWTEGEYAVNLGCRIAGDSAMYFRSHQMNNTVAKFGFQLQHSSPYRQHANGLIERAWQSIHTRSAAMRDAAGLNYNTWWYTDNHAAKLHNSFPNTIHAGSLSPYELVYGYKQNLDVFKTIGQRIVVKRQVRSKSQEKGRVGIYLGQNEALNSHIIAFEKQDKDRIQPPIVHSRDISTDPKPLLQKRLLQGTANIEASGYIPYDVNGEIDGALYDIDTNNIWQDKSYTNGFEELIGTPPCPVVDAEPSVKRVRFNPTPETIVPPPPSHPPQPIPTVNDSAWNGIDLSDDLTSADGTGTIDATFWQANLAVGKKYTSSKAAFADKQFGHLHRQAVKDEHEQLKFFGVLEECLISEATNANEHIFRPVQSIYMKGDSDGLPIKSKARTCMDGSTQNLTASEKSFTFTPKQSTVRYVLSEAAGIGAKLFSMDLPNAFSQSIAPNAKYMYMPKGTEKRDPVTSELIIYRVNNLYGRKDAGFNFQTDLVQWMKSIGFIQNKFDHALFRREATTTEQKIECVIWIDDFLASAKSQSDAEWLKNKVEARWAPGGKSVKFEPAHFFLGANISQTSEHIKLSQRAYIDTWVAELRADGTITGPLPKPTTPLPCGYEINRKHCPGNPTVKSKFRTLVAKIGWVSLVSRPDVAFAAHSLAKVAMDPSPEHIELGMRVVAYLANTSDIGIQYNRKNNQNQHHLRASADASHQSDPTSRKSTSGYIAYLNGGALNWVSKGQTLVTLSSCESEIVSAVEATKDVLFLRRMIADQRTSTEPATELEQDNTSAIMIIENPDLALSGSRSKHIHARYLWVKQNIDAGEIILKQVRTDDMTSDFFTKSLSPPKFLRFRSMIMSA
jgi:hypothetical protein